MRRVPLTRSARKLKSPRCGCRSRERGNTTVHAGANQADGGQGPVARAGQRHTFGAGAVRGGRHIHTGVRGSGRSGTAGHNVECNVRGYGVTAPGTASPSGPVRCTAIGPHACLATTCPQRTTWTVLHVWHVRALGDRVCSGSTAAATVATGVATAGPGGAVDGSNTADSA